MTTITTKERNHSRARCSPCDEASDRVCPQRVVSVNAHRTMSRKSRKLVRLLKFSVSHPWMTKFVTGNNGSTVCQTLSWIRNPSEFAKNTGRRIMKLSASKVTYFRCIHLPFLVFLTRIAASPSISRAMLKHVTSIQSQDVDRKRKGRMLHEKKRIQSNHSLIWSHTAKT